MDADTTLEILKDVIAGNEHKHTASDRDEALRIFSPISPTTARNSSGADSGQFIPCEPPASSPSSRR